MFDLWYFLGVHKPFQQDNLSCSLPEEQPVNHCRPPDILRQIVAV